MHTHRGPGRWTRGQKSSVWKQGDFQGSSFSEVAGPATRLWRVSRGGGPEAGRQVPGTGWESATVRRGQETMAPTHVHFAPGDGRPADIREDGGT